jgi:hypothetical protein
MAKQPRLEWEEAKGIADILTKTNNPNDDYALSENALTEKWNIDIGTFYEIANGIFGMIEFGMSPITQTPIIGIKKENAWIAKKEGTEQFLNAVIDWLTQGRTMSKEEKGYMRKIIIDGKPEYSVAIFKPDSKVVIS